MFIFLTASIYKVYQAEQLTWTLLTDSRTQHEYVDAIACEPTHEYTGALILGQVIKLANGAFLRGHGTYFDNSKLIERVGGVVERVNQLISVKSIATRYFGEVRDIMVVRAV